jgi:hypothetical protein
MSQPTRIIEAANRTGGLRRLCVLAAIVGALAGCQSASGGRASLNANYSSYQACNTYDYSKTELGLCPGRQWH